MDKTSKKLVKLKILNISQECIFAVGDKKYFSWELIFAVFKCFREIPRKFLPTKISPSKVDVFFALLEENVESEKKVLEISICYSKMKKERDSISQRPC